MPSIPVRLLLVVALLQFSSTRADEAPDAERPFGIETRVAWTTSRVVGSPDPPIPYRVERVFPQLDVEHPIYIEREPGTDGYLLVHQTAAWSGAGRIRRFADDPDVSETQLLMEMDRLIYGLTFHPNYDQNGYLYVIHNGPLKADNKHNRISRFTVSREAPHEIEPDSELVILEWETNGHNGGDLAFGPDGLLYCPTGDGTSDSDTLDSGQDITNLLSVMIRIDVDHPTDERPYSIPADNPFLQIEGARHEAWAFGFRNPWRVTFDRKTGHLWVGNNGQDLWEQIFFVRRGENYGWSVYEGNYPFRLGRKRGPAPIARPALEHSHSEARSLTGGVVYYGDKLPELNGAYVYGDYSTGRIWAARHDGEQVTWHQELARSTLQITGFGISPASDLLICDHGGGINRLIPSRDSADTTAEFPRKLSDTGLFDSVADNAVSAGVIPYSVVAPAWADGAAQERFLAIPGTDQLKTKENAFEFPDGAVLMKTLSIEADAGKPESRRRVETQLLVKQLGQWAGYSYRWNDEQTDAELVPTEGAEFVVNVSEADSDDGAAKHHWRIASRVECMMCHSRAAQFVLGFTPMQLDREHEYAAATDHQLRTLKHIGVTNKQPLPKQSLVDPYDDAADLTARARSYLHVNCAICHIQAGGGNAAMQLDLPTALEKADIIDVAPKHDRFGIASAKLIAPGDPDRSVLLFRLAKLGGGRMPRAGSDVVDTVGVRLMREWIESLPSVPPSPAVARLREQNDSALARITSPETADDDRQAAIDELLSTTSGAMTLLAAHDDRRLSTALRDEVVSRARGHEQAPARDLFERFIPPDQRVKRLGAIVDPVAILALPGDAERGRQLFLHAPDVQCKSCHRIGNGDPRVGPDLTHVGKNNSRGQLLESMLEPSKRIDDKFRAHLIETTDGRILSGVVIERTDDGLILQDAQNKLVRIPTKKIFEEVAQQRSLMPELLLRDLTAQQVADLVEFLANQK